MASRGRYMGALWCWKMKTFSIGAPAVDEGDDCWVRTLVLKAHAFRSVETWYIMCLAYARNSPLITRYCCVCFRPWSTSHNVTALLNLVIPSCTLRQEQKCQLCMSECGYNLARWIIGSTNLQLWTSPLTSLICSISRTLIKYIITNTL